MATNDPQEHLITAAPDATIPAKTPAGSFTYRAADGGAPPAAPAQQGSAASASRLAAQEPGARPRKRVKRGGPVGTLRLAAALSAGKLAAKTGRMLKVGGGTSLPGVVARRIDPKVLRKVVGGSRAGKIVVCGSNGKTTTCRMLDAIARAGGRRVTQNRSGSNLLPGVTAVAVNGASIFGRLDADVLVFEVDEATIRRAVPEIEPDVVIVNNIFRDQLDRYGELYSVARALEAMIRELPPEATVVLNGDDPLVASFAPDAVCHRLYFGMRTEDVGTQVPEHAADTIRCVRCQHDLDYTKAYISHLGAYRCPHCGYARPSLDIAVTAVQLDPLGPTHVTLETPAGPLSYALALQGLHNVYNSAGAVAGALALGLDLAAVPDAYATLRPAFGRLEDISAGDKHIVLAFVKNPISYNTTLRTILQRPGQKHVLSCHSNAVTDGEDFAWLWDIDLEELTPQLASLVTSGTKADELAMRFKYAGVPEDKVRVIAERPTALDAALASVEPGGTLYILAGYTPLHELRRVMMQRGWVPPFWEE
jgi:lipid II isoglutaminyl synthase (glutamine-hydrolysing)